MDAPAFARRGRLQQLRFGRSRPDGDARSAVLADEYPRHAPDGNGNFSAYRGRGDHQPDCAGILTDTRTPDGYTHHYRIGFTRADRHPNPISRGTGAGHYFFRPGAARRLPDRLLLASVQLRLGAYAVGR